jgi:hypothetical protein
VFNAGSNTGGGGTELLPLVITETMKHTNWRIKRTPWNEEDHKSMKKANIPSEETKKEEREIVI